MDPTSLTGANALLDPLVISAVVAGVFSALTGLFGWLTSRGKKSERKQLRQEQLGCFYEPFDYLLSFKPSVSPEDTLADIVCLMAEHYRHATPGIQQEITRLLQKETLNAEDFSDLRKMVSSVYNWLRRSLNYPYDKKQINYKHLPQTVSTLYSLIDYISWLAYVISLLMGLAAVGFVCSLIPMKIYKAIGTVLVIALFGFMAYLFGWMAFHAPKKK